MKPTTQQAELHDQEKPRSERYHDHHPVVRRSLAASVFPPTSASFLRLPHFYPNQWPVGATLLYILTLLAGIASAIFLGLLASFSGNTIMAIALPAVLLATEFLLVPLIKFGPLFNKSCASMREYLAEDRQTREAFQQQTRAWCIRDWIAFTILIATFAIKAYVLASFGTYLTNALLLLNWTAAIGELAVHLRNVTSKVSYFITARVIDWFHRRSRLRKAATTAITQGTNKMGTLQTREFEFESPVDLRDDEVEDTVLARDGMTSRWHVRSHGTLTDDVRATFLNRQSNPLCQSVLAPELARIQLMQLEAPEQRAGSPRSASEIETVADIVSPVLSSPSRNLPDSAVGRNGLPAALTIIVATAVTIGSFSGCGPVGNLSAANKQQVPWTTPHVLVIQPASSQVAETVTDALNEPLTAVATASSGKNIPIPQLRILGERGDVTTLTINEHTRGLGTFLFGTETPAAKQRHLSLLFAELRRSLSAGAKGQTLDASTTRACVEKAFVGAKFRVWAMEGIPSLWNDGEGGIVKVVDRQQFVEQFGHDGGNWVLLTDSLRPAAPTSPIASRSNAAAEAPVTASPPPLNAIKENAESSVAAPRNADTIIFDLKNYPGAGSSSKTDTDVALTLPKGVVLMGKTHFETNSAKLSPSELAMLKELAQRMKGSYGTGRIFLVGTADYRSGEAHNSKLSKDRAVTVEAALLQEGLTVERSICVGSGLATRTNDQSALVEQRCVEIYFLSPPASAAVNMP